jgi:hypothetical protein
MQNKTPETPETPANSPFSKPVLTWSEFWFELIGVTDSTARRLTAGPNAPRFFKLGRQRHIKLDDALAWLEQMAATSPYIPSKNNSRKGVSHVA